MSATALALSFMMTACDANKLNRSAANVNKLAMEIYENPTASLERKTSSLGDTYNRARATQSSLSKSAQTMTEVTAGYEAAKTGLLAAKLETSRMMSGARNSLQRTARKMPSSKRQANKMAYDWGKRWLDSYRRDFEQFANRVHRKRDQRQKPRSR